MKTSRGFLAPTWKKLLLPTALVLAFLYGISFYNDLGAIGDRYNCEYMKTAAELNHARIEKDEQRFNQTVERLWGIEDKSIEDTRSLILSTGQIKMRLMDLFALANPVMPASCEYNQIIMKDCACPHYIRPETVACFNTEAEKIKSTTGGLYANGELRMPGRCRYNAECTNPETVQRLAKMEYISPDYFATAAGAVIIALEGYLLSCSLTYFMENRKKKDENQ
jgi:hypothetical protein